MFAIGIHLQDLTLKYLLSENRNITFFRIDLSKRYFNPADQIFPTSKVSAIDIDEE